MVDAFTKLSPKKCLQELILTGKENLETGQRIFRDEVAQNWGGSSVIKNDAGET